MELFCYACQVPTSYGNGKTISHLLAELPVGEQSRGMGAATLLGFAYGAALVTLHSHSLHRAQGRCSPAGMLDHICTKNLIYWVVLSALVEMIEQCLFLPFFFFFFSALSIHF